MMPSRRPVVLGVSLTALLCMGSCTTLARYAVEGALEAATGEEVALADGGDQGWRTGQTPRAARPADTKAAAAVYEVGPTPGWEAGFREYTSMGSGYYRNSVCLNLPLQIDPAGIWSPELASPFASSDRLEHPLLVQENNRGIDPGYTRFGEVRPGGPSPPAAMVWRSADLLSPYGSTRISCPLLGIISFGRPGATALILR